MLFTTGVLLSTTVPTAELYDPENAKSLTGGTASGCALARKLSTVLSTLLSPGPAETGALTPKETCRVTNVASGAAAGTGRFATKPPALETNHSFPRRAGRPGPEWRQRTPREARTQTALQEMHEPT